MQHDFPLHHTPETWAQLALRAFARSTNLLISGQSFSIVSAHCAHDCAHTRSLAALLRGFGAHLSSDDSLVQATFIVAPSGRVAQEEADRLGGVRVLAPLQGEAVVIDADGHALIDPYDLASAANPEVAAAYGARRIEWARAHMPITRHAVERLSTTHSLDGLRVGLALVLEPKTAVLALELAAAGADVHVFGHADETRDDVAEVLRRRGLKVYAEAGATREREEQLAAQFLGARLHYLLDDGSHLIRMAHDDERAPAALTSMVGAAEETTSGLRPLREWQSESRLKIPVMASNDARSKTLFDNAYGTGQSCLFTTVDLIDPDHEGVDMSEHHIVIIGYGDVGRGLAHYAAALGARVSIVEIDPVRALTARMDGYATASLEQAAPHATIMFSATGERNTITLDTLRSLPHNAVVSVAGGVDQEIALDDALHSGARYSSLRRQDGSIARNIDALVFPGGHSVRVADRGGCINCTAGEGNPIEIMDLSFAVQIASLNELITHGRQMSPAVHPLPRQADDEVAGAALRCWQPIALLPSETKEDQA